MSPSPEIDRARRRVASLRALVADEATAVGERRNARVALAELLAKHPELEAEPPPAARPRRKKNERAPAKKKQNGRAPRGPARSRSAKACPHDGPPGACRVCEAEELFARAGYDVIDAIIDRLCHPGR